MELFNKRLNRTTISPLSWLQERGFGGEVVFKPISPFRTSEYYFTAINLWNGERKSPRGTIYL